MIMPGLTLPLVYFSMERMASGYAAAMLLPAPIKGHTGCNSPAPTQAPVCLEESFASTILIQPCENDLAMIRIQVKR